MRPIKLYNICVGDYQNRTILHSYNSKRRFIAGLKRLGYERENGTIDVNTETFQKHFGKYTLLILT